MFSTCFCGIISLEEGDVMYSLFIDTHGSSVVLVLFKDGKVLCNKTSLTNNKHSVATFPLIEELFKENNLDVHDLSQILVVNGPGSFTGVRIAVTIAKTLAYTLGIPIRVIDSLTILSLNVNDDTKYVAIPDRNGAFVGLFCNGNKVNEFKYYSKIEYEELKNDNKVYEEADVIINYEVVYNYMNSDTNLDVNPHLVNPLYVKGLNVRDDK